jgi:hypothetical protein
MKEKFGNKISSYKLFSGLKGQFHKLKILVAHACEKWNEGLHKTQDLSK